MRCVALLALAGCLLGAPLHGQVPLRLAILPGEGERAPAPALVAQVEVALTQEKEIALLERAEVRRILAEQKLTLSGLADPRTAARVGQLLSVELFLFIERVQKTPSLIRVQLVETLTGITVTSCLVDEKSFEADVDAIRTLTVFGITKSRVPLGERHGLGIIGVRNEEPGRFLDSVAKALEAVLANDLSQASHIQLLDREHLRWLTGEQQLSDAQLQLRSSTLLIEGGLRRTRDGTRLTAAFQLRRVGKGAGREVILEAPLEFAPARREIVAALLKALDVAAAGRTPQPVEQEARMFLNRSRFLARDGDTEGALRAAEAAYALWPGETTLLDLATVWRDHAYTLSLDIWRDGKDTGTASVAAKLRTLQARLRGAEVTYDYVRRRVETLTRDPKAWFPNENLVWGDLGVILVPDQGEALTLQREAAELDRRTFDTLVAFARQREAPKLGLYWDLWQRAFMTLRIDLPGQEEEKAKALATCLNALADPITGDPKQTHYWNFMMTTVGERLQRCGYDAARRAQCEPYARVLKAFAGHENPFLRLISAYALVMMDVDKKDAAENILATLARDFPPSHPMRFSNADQVFCNIAAPAVESLSSPKERAMACDRLLKPYLENPDEGWRVATWARMIELWLSSLENAGDWAGADAAAEKAIHALAPWTEKWRPWETKVQLRKLEERRAAYALKLGQPPPATTEWRGYEFRAVRYEDMEPGAVLTAGKTLYCVTPGWFELYRPPRDAGLCLKVYDLRSGGRPLHEWRLGARIPAMATSPADLTLLGRTLYFGTMQGLAVVDLDTGRASLITEKDGLPSNEVMALAALGGKLYISLSSWNVLAGSTGFACYDPAERAIRLIASSKSVESRNPFDGRGFRRIGHMLSDTGRDCLWLATMGDGLWQYRPATDRFEQVFNYRWPLRVFRWESGALFCYDLHRLFTIDPERRTRVWLAGSFAPAEERDPPVAFEESGVPCWPAALDRDRLITGGEALFLHQRGRPAERSNRLKEVWHLERTARGILALGAGGNACFIERQDAREEKP